jgi:hypothetical protein
MPWAGVWCGLARGIYPAVLESDGLAEALRAAARRAALPTTVTAAAVGRFDALIEGAVYFSCLEAMQNADMRGQGLVGLADGGAGGLGATGFVGN